MHLLESRGELPVAFELAVLGQVAGNEKHVGLILPDGFEQLEINVAALGEDLTVAVEGVRVVLGVLYHGRGKVMRVAHDGDLQIDAVGR